MKVHIVTEGNWIKKFWSDKIIEYNDTEIEYSLSFQQKYGVDINFYVCYNMYLFWPKSQKPTLDIGYVTHIHKNDMQEHSRDIGIDFNRIREMDYYIHQSKRSMSQFTQFGFPPEKSCNLTSPIEIHKFYPTIVLGIFQNGGVDGKGLFFLNDLLTKYDFKNFKFLFCGKDWESSFEIMKKRRIRYEHILYSPEHYHEVQQRTLYEKIDYLFVPSLWEGGPVAPLEAMASGVPIISSDVGLIPEFSVEYMYEAGNTDQLISIMNKIEGTIIERRKKVEHLSYVNFNRKLVEIFKGLLN